MEIRGDGDHGECMFLVSCCELLWTDASLSQQSWLSVIEACEFRNGESNQFGGNVAVDTSGTLSIVNSTFSGGQAVTSGAGLYVLNARMINVTDSVFENNTVTLQDSTGGGLFSAISDSTADYSQQINIQGTTFEANTADLGGGFFVTQLGSLPSVRILESVFDNNTARQAGKLEEDIIMYLPILDVSIFL